MEGMSLAEAVAREEFLRQQLEHLREHLGPQARHEMTAQILCSLAILRREAHGDHASAEKLLEEALRVLGEMFRPDAQRFDIAAIFWELAATAAAREDFEAAERWRAVATAMFEVVHDADADGVCLTESLMTGSESDFGSAHYIMDAWRIRTEQANAAGQSHGPEERREVPEGAGDRAEDLAEAQPQEPPHQEPPPQEPPHQTDDGAADEPIGNKAGKEAEEELREQPAVQHEDAREAKGDPPELCQPVRPLEDVDRDVDAMTRRAYAKLHFGQVEAADAEAAEALRMAPETGGRQARKACLLRVRGVARITAGDFAAGAALLEQAASIWRGLPAAAGSHVGVAVLHCEVATNARLATLRDLGMVCQELGQLEAAQAAFEEALLTMQPEDGVLPEEICFNLLAHLSDIFLLRGFSSPERMYHVHLTMARVRGGPHAQDADIVMQLAQIASEVMNTPNPEDRPGVDEFPRLEEFCTRIHAAAHALRGRQAVHESTAHAVYIVGITRMMMGNVPGAIATLEEALGKFHVVHGVDSDHANIKRTRDALALLRSELAKYTAT